jgi:cell division septation protein DedD
MIKHRAVLSLCCALVLALSGCSRQQSDWQKTREANTTDAYEQFLKKYPSGEFTAQAQARVKELYEERDWQKARDADTPEAYQAFLKQYPEGKWTEEARIRVENFTLAQAPSGAAATPGTADAGGAPAGAPPAGSDAAEKAGSPATPMPPKVAKPPEAAAPAKAAPRAAPPASQATTKSGKEDSGAYGIQLGAFKSGPQAAHERWVHLQKEYPTILAGLSSKIVPKKTASGHLYRLQATGLSEKHARAVCGSLKAKSQVCLVVPPVRD